MFEDRLHELFQSLAELPKEDRPARVDLGDMKVLLKKKLGAGAATPVFVRGEHRDRRSLSRSGRGHVMSADMTQGPSGKDLAALEEFAQGVLIRASQTEEDSLERLLPAIYDEFRVLAEYLLRGEETGRTLRATALAHETYLRLARETRFRPAGPEHLLAVAATVMRRVIIDYARARKAAKRGGDAARVSLSESLLDPRAQPVEVLDLQRALDRMAGAYPRKVQIVEMLYFTGLSVEEAAEVLGISTRTVLRDWRFARAWLWRELSGDPAEFQESDAPDSRDRRRGETSDPS